MVTSAKSSLRDMPSFHAVMRMEDMRSEALSILTVEVPPGAVTMTKAEVRFGLRPRAQIGSPRRDRYRTP